MVKRKLSWYDNSIENERLAYGKGAAVVKKMNIPVGISDFEKIRKNGYYYVDKSGLIAELLREESTEVTLITRPRRFGKTLGMSMLNSFFQWKKTAASCLTDLQLCRRKRFAQNG